MVEIKQGFKYSLCLFLFQITEKSSVFIASSIPEVCVLHNDAPPFLMFTQ